MDAASVGKMLHDDRDAWQKLVDVLEARPQESLHEPESPRWTSRNVYIHIAHSVEGSLAQLEAKLTGRPVPQLEGDEDEHNERRQQEHSHLSLDDARSWAEEAVERRPRTLEQIPAGSWDEELEQIARYDGSEHYAGHLGYIVLK